MGGEDQAGNRGRCGCGAGHLTNREIEVLRLAAMGLSSNEIARKLGISPRTVDDHLSVMRQRVGAADRGELIARCYAAEILLLGWPPRWSGRRCVQILQRPGCSLPSAQVTVFRTRSVNDSAGASTMSDHPRVPRFPYSSGSIEQADDQRTALLEIARPRCAAAMGVLIGYARLSTRDQNLARQISALTAAGCSVIFAEEKTCKHSAEFRRLLDSAHCGDTLVVVSLDRLCDSSQDLIRLLADLGHRGLGLKSLHEHLDTTAPCGQLIFHVFDALAEFLRQVIVERTRDGLAAARARGVVGGRPTVMTAEKISAARALLPANSIASIARQLAISRSTLYAHIEALRG